MDLLTPGLGLIFWQLVGFLGLLFLLGKFAWKPILGALKEREQSIESALASAESAKLEMQQLKADNEKLLDEARAERDKILHQAKEAAKAIEEEAQANASKRADKIISDAEASIETKKAAALADIKNQVADLSLQITEKLLRQKLASDQEQRALVEEYLKDVKVN
ncbi:F0F1 ATP synthase subunit B [Roseivirga sp. BDSF3-8]|uniref:F0F1 ATP synthase subunit B n=1 Tax=Roseivirga sp. BDSF3-8 TaxID=3241598 RepID=UPI0035323CDC